jgi:hypothetical protein
MNDTTPSYFVMPDGIEQTQMVPEGLLEPE